MGKPVGTREGEEGVELWCTNGRVVRAISAPGEDKILFAENSKATLTPTKSQWVSISPHISYVNNANFQLLLPGKASLVDSKQLLWLLWVFIIHL